MPVAVQAQEPTRVWRIGFLGAGSYSSGDPRIEALRRGFQELGYAEGRNVVFEFRWAGGHADRLSALAMELAKAKVDAIVTQGTQATTAARRAATSIPVVFAVAGDPVGTGLVTSLAGPGGNITGLTDIAPEVVGKRLELLREAVPGIARIAVLWNPANPSAAPQMKHTVAVARALGLSVASAPGGSRSGSVRVGRLCHGDGAHGRGARRRRMLELPTLFGYGLRKPSIDPSPLVVALVLGPLMEKTLRQALSMERGNVLALGARPLTLALLLLGAAAVLGPPLARWLRGRRAAGASVPTAVS